MTCLYSLILQLDIVLQWGNSEERELFKGVECQKDHRGNIKLAPIINYISQMGFPVKDNMISYFSASEQAYVFLGSYPFPQDITIPIEDIEGQQRLTLKCRPQSIQSPLLHDKKAAAIYKSEDDNTTLVSDQPSLSSTDQKQANQQSAVSQ